MIDLCFATNNPGKLEEIQAILGEKINIKSLQQIGCFEELPETTPTLEGNSKQKAEFVWNHYHVNCFADDTGLEVFALHGAPGVISARYAGEHCSPEDNMKLLLKNMEGVTDRRASFRTVITLFLKSEVLQFEGIVAGEILESPRGNKGFGYDPIFKPEGSDKSFAEMEMNEKNAISHRARAVEGLAAYLESKTSNKGPIYNY